MASDVRRWYRTLGAIYLAGYCLFAVAIHNPNMIGLGVVTFGASRLFARFITPNQKSSVPL